jgi:16S rRNA (guanine527-N7)-methyltransferase
MRTGNPGRPRMAQMVRPSWQSGVVTDEGLTDDRLRRLREKVDPALDPVFRRSFELGFLGSMPVTDQVEHALGFAAILESELGGPPASVIDLGTGGGVPGLVLASCWPDTRVVLMDANERRTTFLQEVVDGWSGSGRAEVLRGRAEELGRNGELRERFDGVTSRSFGLPAATAECGSSFLAVGGSMVISEPPDSDPRERWPEAGLRQLGLAPVTTLRPVERFGYQVLRKFESLDDRFPRRVGIPVKRPLF